MIIGRVALAPEGMNRKTLIPSPRPPALCTYAPINPDLTNYASLSNFADEFAWRVPSALSPNLTGDTLVENSPAPSTRIASENVTGLVTWRGVAEKAKEHAEEAAEKYAEENARTILVTGTPDNAVSKIEDTVQSTRGKAAKEMCHPSHDLGPKLTGNALLAGKAVSVPKSAPSSSGASPTWASEQKRCLYQQRQSSSPTSVLLESARQASWTDHAQGYSRSSWHGPESQRQPEAYPSLVSNPRRNWPKSVVSDPGERTDIPSSSYDMGALYHTPPSLCLSETTLVQHTDGVDRDWTDNPDMPPHLSLESPIEDPPRVIRTRRQQSKTRANIQDILTIKPNVRLGAKSMMGRLRTKFAFRKTSTAQKYFPHPLAELDSAERYELSAETKINELPATRLSRSTSCTSILPTPTRFFATPAVASSVSQYMDCEVAGLLRPLEPAMSRKSTYVCGRVGATRLPIYSGTTAAGGEGTGSVVKPAPDVSVVANPSGREPKTARLLEEALPKLEDNSFGAYTLRRTLRQRDRLPIPYPRSFRICKAKTPPLRLSSSNRIRKRGYGGAGTTPSQVQPGRDVPAFEEFSKLFAPATRASPIFNQQRLGGSAQKLAPESETYTAYTSSMAGLPQDPKSSEWSNGTVANSKGYGKWYPIRRTAPLLTYLGLVTSAVFLEIERKVRHVGELISVRQKVPEGLVRINWTCTCGDRLYDDFLELQPGAANCLQALLNKPRTHTPGSQSQSSSSSNANSIFSTSSSHRSTSSATSGDISDARTESSSNPYKNRLSQAATANPFLVSFGPHAQLLNLLTCVDEEKFAPKLSHLCMEPSRVRSDKDVAVSLRQLYSSVNDKWYKRFRLRGLQTIEFVQFEVHRSTRFADIRKRPDMPPPPYLSDYDFEPGQLIPPVGSMYLMHLFKHPEDYDSERITYSRMPKRRGRLEEGVGWGINLVEGFLASRVWGLVIGFFLLASITFVVVWLAKRHDDLQGAFAVTAWMCTFAALIVAWAQACLG